MLTQVCKEINNWFVRSRKDIHTGTFTITDGQVTSAEFLYNGQYFCIVGSVFNDGVHQFGVNDLKDEEFSGEIWGMAIPKEVIDLSDEIKDWVDKYGAKALSPFSSESFAGYAYTKSTASSSSGGFTDGASWQSVFAGRLNTWRKI